jgi:hypothetical protein
MVFLLPAGPGSMLTPHSGAATIVLRKNLVRHRSARLFASFVVSQVVIGQESAVIVRFEPVIEVKLVRVGGHDLLSQFVGCRAKKATLVPASTAPPLRLEFTLPVESQLLSQKSSSQQSERSGNETGKARSE